jgi:hypothetical protein
MERENRLRRTCAAGLRTRAEGQSSLGGRMTLLVHHRGDAWLGKVCEGDVLRKHPIIIAVLAKERCRVAANERVNLAASF